MARIMLKEIWWNGVDGASGYNVYIAKEPGSFSYNLEHIQTEETRVVAPDDFPPGTFDVETDYYIWITAVDAQGNESDPLQLTHPFDFVPPGVPSGGGVRDLGLI